MSDNNENPTPEPEESANADEQAVQEHAEHAEGGEHAHEDGGVRLTRVVPSSERLKSI